MNKGRGSFFWLMACPILSLPVALLEIKRGYYKSCWVIVLFLGLFAYLFPPYSDLARNILKVRLLAEDANLAAYFFDLDFDFLIPFGEYIFIKLGIPIELFRFIYTSIVYALYTLIYIDISKRFDLHGNLRFLLYLILLLTVFLFALVINTRTAIAYSLFFFILYKVYICGEIKKRFLALIMPFIHFATIPIVVCFFIAYHWNFKIKSRKIFGVIAIILLTVVQVDVVSPILRIFSLGAGLDQHVQSYTDGAWSPEGNAWNALNLNHKIMDAINTISRYYIMVIYFFIIKDRQRLDSLNAILIALLALVNFYPIIFGRFAHFMEVAMLLSIIYNVVIGNLKICFLRGLLLVYFFMGVCNIYVHWNCLVNGNEKYLFTPYPYALSQTYDFDKWINYHLSDDFHKFEHKSALSR